MTLSIDGKATATGNGSNANGSTNFTIAPVLTTSDADDVIYLTVTIYGTGPSNFTTSISVSISDSAGLTWTKRATAGNASGTTSTTVQFAYYAIASSALSSDTITISVTVSSSAITNTAGYGSAVVFGVNGANTTSPFDPNSSVPATATGTGTAPTVNISTTNSSDLIIGALGNTAAEYGSNGSAYVFIDGVTQGTNTGQSDEAGFATSAVTNQAVNFSLTTSSYWVLIADAITVSTGATTTGELTAKLRASEIASNKTTGEISTQLKATTTSSEVSSGKIGVGFALTALFVTQQVQGEIGAALDISYVVPLSFPTNPTYPSNPQYLKFPNRNVIYPSNPSFV